MVTKFHTAKSGKNAGGLVKCSATKVSCPVGGGEENHQWFDKSCQAEEYSELALAKSLGEHLSSAQEARFKELQKISDSNNPYKTVRKDFGMYADSLRFLGDITPGEAKAARELLETKFKEGKLTGKGIHQGRVEVKISDRHANCLKVGIVAEDLVNGGYLYGEQSRGSFYPRHHSSNLDEVITEAAKINGYNPGEEETLEAYGF